MGVPRCPDSEVFLTRLCFMPPDRYRIPTQLIMYKSHRTATSALQSWPPFTVFISSSCASTLPFSYFPLDLSMLGLLPNLQDSGRYRGVRRTRPGMHHHHLMTRRGTTRRTTRTTHSTTHSTTRPPIPSTLGAYPSHAFVQ